MCFRPPDKIITEIEMGDVLEDFAGELNPLSDFPESGHPRPSRCHADDGGFGLNCRRVVAAQQIVEECHVRTYALSFKPPNIADLCG